MLDWLFSEETHSSVPLGTQEQKMTKKHIIFRCDFHPPLRYSTRVGTKVCLEFRWTQPQLPEMDIT